jgi:RimJ/RimL family protein N-acetyltransferase
MCNELCKKEEIVLDEKEILLRTPKISDVRSLLKFVNSLVEEDALILVNKKYTLKEELEWLKDHLKRIKENKLHDIVAFHKNEVIGKVDIRKGNWRSSHVATLGISVRKDYRRLGLGTLLMKKAIKLSKKDPEIKILELGVIEGNYIAEKLYKKLGFKFMAKLPKRFLYKGRYVDDIIMDYPLKKI